MILDADILVDLSRYRLSHNLGIVDAMITATALDHGQPLATFNVRHFGTVPGLMTTQPYQR